ncbi:unnamed protein product [Gongylonema pulchrum]|uniref:Uncharacterized protein n=1 Tax=Gongylonema pulchrum TaxID=637853 RepID=A0A183EDP8_9BILA|nr:unnamed protein product [Gongylonema pulchrum]
MINSRHSRAVVRWLEAQYTCRHYRHQILTFSFSTKKKRVPDEKLNELCIPATVIATTINTVPVSSTVIIIVIIVIIINIVTIVNTASSSYCY